MGDDTNQQRTPSIPPTVHVDDADAPSPEPVPAGGAGADSGAVEVARIDDADQAEVANISSQNDIPGVGTRAADGSMESGQPNDRRSRG